MARDRNVRHFVTFSFVVAWSVSSAIAAAPPSRPPTDEEFKERASRIARRKEVPTKLAALKWLQSNAKARNAALAIPALEKSVRADPDATVRCESILALAWIARNHKKPCPLPIVEALLDQDDVVHSYACIAEGFQTFEPGSIKVLLRCAQSEREMVRQNSILLLLAAGGKDRKVLEVIAKARQDESFGVRHNAYVALFKANDRLRDFLHWIIRVQEGEDRPIDPKVAAKERVNRDLVVLGMARQIMEWQDERPEDLSRALVKLLDDKSPSIRRGAARLTGAAFLKYSDDDRRPEKSACAPHLEKLKAETWLQKRCDADPDLSVRAAARRALRQWKSVQK